jgi:PPK2 family polyphosphate:nucleotide phosphotransferase
MINLDKFDPEDKSAFNGKKEKALEELFEITGRLDELQEIIHAESKHRVLVVLQGIDTAGKDGTIRSVFGDINPSGCRVANFKVPTIHELARDYLWRVHLQTPGKGEIVIFNRSHYEDVLVVRVHSLVPEEVWKKRYSQINDFERMLADEGTTILKFFLYIDKEEQRKRLQERVDNPKKRWKFSLGDLKERELWPQYIAAYEDMLNKTSTVWAPWYVIPSNSNWYRNWLVAKITLEWLERLNPQLPQLAEDISKVVVV